MLREYPMYRSDGPLVQLANILSSLKGSDLVWSILEFYGTSTGELINGQTLLELEHQCKTREKGVILPWTELIKFSSKLTQTIDGVFVGVTASDKIDREAIYSGIYDKCEVVVQANDSSSWTVFCRDEKQLVQIENQVITGSK